MSKVVQAAEKVVVETTTAVVTQVVQSTAGDVKTMESSVVKEAVAATDEPVTSLLGKVQDGLEDIASEVVKGAESALATVERHPELIAEGALAVVIGAASIIQPELAPGELAIIGKMAADSAEKTITTIASDEGSKVVKAVSQDIADDVKEEQAKDLLAKTAKEKAETIADRRAPEASEVKAAPAQMVKDEANSTKMTEDPKIAGVVTTSQSSVSNPSTTTSSADSKDRTVDVELSQEPSKAANSQDHTPTEPETDSPSATPVSLKFTLGADGEVNSVAKHSVKPKRATTGPHVAPDSTSKSTSAQMITKTAIVNTAPVEETKVTSAVQEQPVAILSTQRPSDETQKDDQTLGTSNKKEQVVPQPRSVDPEPALNPEEGVARTEALTDITPNASILSSPDKSADSKGKISNISDITLTTAPETISAATVISTTKITDQTSLNTGTGSSELVTVSQESLDLLHQKIDTMHEAIQQITKLLALRLTPSTTSAVESVESIINEALATTIKPLTDLVPEIMAQNGEASHPPLNDPSIPKASQNITAHQKRSSVLGSIGKVFWPFGSSGAATTITETEVVTHRAEGL